MVSCGPYQIKGALIDIGKRPRLDSGALGIITLSASDPVAAIEAATLSAFGAIDRYEGCNQWEAEEFDVESGSSLALGIDGEAVRMESSVHFEVHAGSFPVAVPRGTPHGPRVVPIGSVQWLERLWTVASGETAP